VSCRGVGVHASAFRARSNACGALMLGLTKVFMMAVSQKDR
jgi:hypothetical protein